MEANPIRAELFDLRQAALILVGSMIGVAAGLFTSALPRSEPGSKLTELSVRWGSVESEKQRRSVMDWSPKKWLPARPLTQPEASQI